MGFRQPGRSLTCGCFQLLAAWGRWFLQTSSRAVCAIMAWGGHWATQPPQLCRKAIPILTMKEIFCLWLRRDEKQNHCHPFRPTDAWKQSLWTVCIPPACFRKHNLCRSSRCPKQTQPAARSSARWSLLCFTSRTRPAVWMHLPLHWLQTVSCTWANIGVNLTSGLLSGLLQFKPCHIQLLKEIWKLLNRQAGEERQSTFP